MTRRQHSPVTETPLICSGSAFPYMSPYSHPQANMPMCCTSFDMPQDVKISQILSLKAFTS